jgi:hypothetical protein
MTTWAWCDDARRTTRQLGGLEGPSWRRQASRRRRGPVALRPRLSLGVPLARCDSQWESVSQRSSRQYLPRLQERVEAAKRPPSTGQRAGPQPLAKRRDHIAEALLSLLPACISNGNSSTPDGGTSRSSPVGRNSGRRSAHHQPAAVAKASASMIFAHRVVRASRSDRSPNARVSAGASRPSPTAASPSESCARIAESSRARSGRGSPASRATNAAGSTS